MRDLSFGKVSTVAWREFRTTALTPAFLIGSVIIPLVIWGVILGVNMLKLEKPALRGTVSVLDTTQNQAILGHLNSVFDVERARAEAARATEELKRVAGEKLPDVPEAQLAAGVKAAQQLTGFGLPAEVTIEALLSEADLEAQRERARNNEILALIAVDETALDLPAAAADPSGAGSPPDAGARSNDAGASPDDGAAATPPASGSYKFVQGAKLRPEHADVLRRAVRTAIEDERMRRAGIDPATVHSIQGAPITADTVVMTEEGEKKANNTLVKVLPFVFMMLLYMGAATGGAYLMMGTLEEKSSRVMEVLLSACSSRELLVGKMVGQGLVGLLTLSIYAGLGMLAADRFNMLAAIPMNVLPWLVVYYLIAYALLGSMYLMVGAAVTEIREAQAFNAPLLAVVILPFVLSAPIMDNPGSLLARIASFFPFTTPYAMIMRLSQPSHVVPMWELIATTLVGFAGVVVLVWAAAKIFRVGVLMYGKPPSILGLLKWIRQA